MLDIGLYRTNCAGKETDFCVADVHYRNNEDISSFEYRQNGEND